MPHRSKPSSAACCLIAAELSIESLTLLHELAEHVRQDAAVRERDQLLRSVDARYDRERLRRAIISARGHHDFTARLERRAGAGEREHLAPGDAVSRRIVARLELQRQHAHVDEVAAMDTLV